MKKAQLLTRTEFREQVLARSQGQCVFCKKAAVDAHHILERRLWNDGGYYLDNGIAVCEEHHKDCEKTIISVEEARTAGGISKVIIPEHLYEDQVYDKWGNIILPNQQRLKGELFNDLSVQKILAEGGVLSQFTDWIKYPRTYHLPWSEGMNDDDRMMKDTGSLENQRIIITEKMDGENTTMYHDYIHARSIDGRSHVSRDWVKQFWSQIKSDIPKGWRVCGENLYAKHSIEYENLDTYFMGFAIWDENNICLGWDETIDWFKLLNIIPVPVLYDDLYDEKKIKTTLNNRDWQKHEGYVIRSAGQIAYKDFRRLVGKFVRKNHVQTVKHWMYGQKMEKNKLKN